MERDSALVSNWDNVTSDGRNELVFEGKNKEYGAYDIRKKYNFSLLIGIVSAALVLTIAVLIPLLNTLWNQEEETKQEEEVVVVSNLEELLPKDKVLPMTPPPPPPPVMEKIKFTIVEITEEEVKDPPVAQTQLDDKKIGEKTEKGDPDATDLPSVEASDDLLGGGEDNTHYTVVQKEAKYPGGMGQLAQDIKDNFNRALVDQLEVSDGLELSFIVTKTGEIGELQITKSSGSKLVDKETLRVLKLLPRWTPAMNAGKPVIRTFVVPFAFGEEE